MRTLGRMTELQRVGTQLDLGSVDTTATPGFVGDKKSGQKALESGIDEFAQLQEQLLHHPLTMVLAQQQMPVLIRTDQGHAHIATAGHYTHFHTRAARCGATGFVIGQHLRAAQGE